MLKKFIKVMNLLLITQFYIMIDEISCYNDSGDIYSLINDTKGGNNNYNNIYSERFLIHNMLIKDCKILSKMT